MLKKESLVYLFGFLIMGILTLMMFSSMKFEQTGNWSNGFYTLTNSDSSLLYQICRDFLKHPGSLSDWNYGTCFYFFPNFIIMLIATVLFSVPSVALFASSVIVFSMQILLINILFNKVFSGISKYSLVIANTIILVFLIYTINSGDFVYYTSHLFLPLHSGAFINTICGLILVFQYLKTGSFKLIILLSLLNIVALFSDMIYIIYFIIPVISTVLTGFFFIRSLHNAKTRILILSVIISGLLGFAIYQFIVIKEILSIYPLERMPENILSSLHLMVNNLVGFSLISPLTFITAVITVISFSLGIFVSIRMLFLSRRNRSDKFLFPEIYLLFTTFCVFITIAATILNGSYRGADCIRYIMPAIYLVSLNTGLLFEYFRDTTGRKVKYNAYIAISLLVFYSSFILINYTKYPPFNSIKKIVQYYPPIAKATDKLSREYNVKNGLTGYWGSRYITLFSREKVIVNSAGSEFNAVSWANNPHSYLFSDYKENDRVIFNFVVVTYLNDTSKVYMTFGPGTIKKVTIDNYDFYLIPDFKVKDDFSGFELVNNEQISFSADSAKMQ
jgi:hypothetical protein